MNNSIVNLIILAFLVETIWEIVKRVIPSKTKIPDWLDVAGSLAIGLLLAFGAKADLLALLGLQLGIPYLGIIITGLAISRGSNFMHDLLGSVSQIYQNKKNPPLAEPPIITLNVPADKTAVIASELEEINPTSNSGTFV